MSDMEEAAMSLRERLAEAIREAVIDWNTLGPSVKVRGGDVSDHLAQALLPVVEREIAAAAASALGGKE